MRAVLIATPFLLTAAGCNLPTLNKSVSPAANGPELPVFQEALATGDRVEAGEPFAAPIPAETASPSLTNGQNRFHWEPVTIQVPVNQVEAQPIYNWWRWPSGEGTARQMGTYPTQFTAMEYRRAEMRDYGEAMWFIVPGFISAGTLPVQIFLDPAWGEKRYPAQNYDRLPITHDGDFTRWFGTYDKDPTRFGTAESDMP